MLDEMNKVAGGPQGLACFSSRRQIEIGRAAVEV